MKQVKSVGAIVYRFEEGQIVFLLLKYEMGHWDLVKGTVEEGETEEETLRREAQEETGITELKLFPGFKHEIKYFFKEKQQLVHKTVVFYLAETSQKDVILSPEHIAFAWLSLAAARETLTFKNAKELLDEAFKRLTNGN